MKLRVLLFLTSSALLGPALGQDSPLKTEKDKISYSIGMNIANAWKRQEVDVDPAVVYKGIQDTFAGKTLLNEQEVKEILTAYSNQRRAQMEETRKVKAEKNKKDEEAFLAENKTKPGIVTLPSGLQYKVLKEGNGPTPKPSDQVVVNYRGTLLDGTEFDSSYKRKEPATFQTTGVIKGWTEALQLMKSGSKLQLYIPSHLAYGDRGAGQTIGPNQTLIFEVELLDIKPAPASTNEPVTSDIIKVPSAEELKKGAKIEIIKPEDLPKKQQP